MDDSAKPPSAGSFSAFIKRMFPSAFSRKGMTEEGLRRAIIEGEKSGVVESKERTMMEGVFYLGDRPVRAFMTHRSEIIWLDIDAGPEEVRAAVENSGGQLCFPVAKEDLDEVKGAVLLQDLFRALLVGEWPGLRAIMRPPYFIPQTMSALKAFEAFKRADAHDLFLMDEYGGFAGVLTVRNLIEEIVGELSASSAEDDTIVKQEDGVWIASGGVSIDDAARVLGIESLGEVRSEYLTLAGFILYLAGEIPRPGAAFDYSGHRFKIVAVDGNRIETVQITKV